MIRLDGVSKKPREPREREVLVVRVWTGVIHETPDDDD